jgi:atrazine chlorohydrolase/5-methylthioadenosine/S-adenosylhomocysteine deaminase/melamine deaminase
MTRRTVTPSLLVRDARVVTMDADRRVLSPGYVAVADDRIIGVGPQAECPYDRAERVIDASRKAVLPGFVNAHTHAIHILMRGGLSDDRALYDWLFNVVLPGLRAYRREDVEVAARLYCLEALRSGVTTFVDNVEFPTERWDMAADTAIGVYRDAGLRVMFARMFYDHTPDDFVPVIEAMEAKEPGVRHDPGGLEPTAEALAAIERLMRRHHDSADGRIQVWPSPGVARFCTREGLLGARDLARRFGTMVTLHLAESPLDRLQGGLPSVEYLGSIGFLGPDVLAGHCVQTDVNDIRTLRAFDVKVANNPVSNLLLASGIAPIAEMQAAGITVGLGTDDGNCNNSVNIVADMKFAALAQKGRYRSAAAITAEKVLEMATIDGARAVGLGDRIGSLERGKKADLVLLDLAHANLVPCHSVASVMVYQANGTEVDTVVVDGRILLEGRRMTAMAPGEEDELLARAQSASEHVATQARLAGFGDRGWRSMRGV